MNKLHQKKDKLSGNRVKTIIYKFGQPIASLVAAGRVVSFKSRMKPDPNAIYRIYSSPIIGVQTEQLLKVHKKALAEIGIHKIADLPLNQYHGYFKIISSQFKASPVSNGSYTWFVELIPEDAQPN